MFEYKKLLVDIRIGQAMLMSEYTNVRLIKPHTDKWDVYQPSYKLTILETRPLILTVALNKLTMIIIFWGQSISHSGYSPLVCSK